MKTHASASICMFILFLTLGAILAAPLTAARAEANLEIDPDRVDLGAYPENFKFKLWFSGKYKNYKVADIDPSTITIEGLPYPIRGRGRGKWRVNEEANTVTFKVDGQWLVDYVVWPKIYHMARVDPNPEQGKWFPYKIDITVTGVFKEDSPFAGTEFSGTDTIHVYVPHDDPPPPPRPS